MQENASPVVVGRVNGVYGVRGWFKIESFTRPKENIFAYSPVLIRVNDAWQEIGLEDSQQRGSERLLVKLKGIDSPEQCREYQHCELAVRYDQLPELKEGEYYWRDLIGLEVFNQDDIKLGIVGDIVETGANDVLIINVENTTRIFIPLMMAIYVKQVDLSAKLIRVEWQPED